MGSEAASGHDLPPRHVLDVAGLMRIALATDAACVALLAVPHLACLDEVGQRSATREYTPVVNVVLVDVPEEAHLVSAVLLAHLARQVMRARQT